MRSFTFRNMASGSLRVPALVMAGALILLSLASPVALAETGTAPTNPAAPTNPPAPPFTLQVKSAILMDAGTGQVLMEQNADVPLPTASLTKVMTLRLAFKAIHSGKISLDQEVVVSPNAWAGRWPGSSLMFLNAGDRVKVRDLLYGITVDSGNDACIAVAETIAGSVDAFVAEMNQEAKALGLQTAHFEDPHGLSPNDQISAREMAMLAQKYIHEFPEALDYHKTKEFSYGTDITTGKPITQQNRNGLLWSYPDADGLKTGHTSEAGFNLVGTAKRGDMRLIGVVLGTPERVGNLTGEAYREQAVASMFNWGFANFAVVQPVAEGTRVGQLPVYKGSKRQVGVTPSEPVAVLVQKGQEKDVTTQVTMDKRYLVGPVARGQKVGTLLVASGGKELGRFDLVTAEDVSRGGFFRNIWDSVRLLFARLFRRGK